MQKTLIQISAGQGPEGMLFGGGAPSHGDARATRRRLTQLCAGERELALDRCSCSWR